MDVKGLYTENTKLHFISTVHSITKGWQYSVPKQNETLPPLHLKLTDFRNKEKMSLEPH